MDKYLHPSRFDYEPNSTGADKHWTHWLRTFENFLSSIEIHKPDKLVTLTNYVAPNVFEYISDCETYPKVIETLKSLYIKPTNEIYARHALATRKQEEGETLDTYLQVLKRLSKDCNFSAVTAEEHRQTYIRDAFINGLQSCDIRRRLLENFTLPLDKAFEQARALEMAHKNSASYNSPAFTASTSIKENTDDQHNSENETGLAALHSSKQELKCYFCGLEQHSRSLCPAKDSNCSSCGKMGHYSCVCRSGFRNSSPKKPLTQERLCVHPHLQFTI